MADPSDVQVIQTISVQNDVAPITRDIDNEGGFRSVADVTERDNIPANKRKHGMRVFVRSTEELFQLESNLTTWVPASGGAVSGDNVLLVATGNVTINVDFQDGVGSKTVVEGVITDRWYDQASLDAIQGGATGFELLNQIWNAGPDIVPEGVTITYNIVGGVHRPDPSVASGIYSWNLKAVQCDGTVDVIGETPDNWDVRISGLNVDAFQVGPGTPGSTAPSVNFGTTNPGALTGLSRQGWCGRVREIDITGIIFAHDNDSVELMTPLTGISTNDTLDIITPNSIFRNTLDDISFNNFIGFQIINRGSGTIHFQNIALQPFADFGSFITRGQTGTFRGTFVIIDHRTPDEDFGVTPEGNSIAGETNVIFRDLSVTGDGTAHNASFLNYRGGGIVENSYFRDGNRAETIGGAQFQESMRVFACFFDDHGLTFSDGGGSVIDLAGPFNNGLNGTYLANTNAGWTAALLYRNGAKLGTTQVARFAFFSNCAATPVVVRNGVDLPFPTYGGGGWQNGPVANTAQYGLVIEGPFSNVDLQSGVNVSGTDPNPVLLASSGQALTYADIVAQTPIAEVAGFVNLKKA